MLSHLKVNAGPIYNYRCFPTLEQFEASLNELRIAHYSGFLTLLNMVRLKVLEDKQRGIHAFVSGQW